MTKKEGWLVEDEIMVKRPRQKYWTETNGQRFFNKALKEAQKESRKDVLKEIEGKIEKMKIKMTKEEITLAKDMGCLSRCQYQELYYNDALSDVKELLKKKGGEV
jgi:hypothetical protein